MEIKVAGCPLGAKCEEVKEEAGQQVLYRCPWFAQLRGNNPTTGKEVDEFACAVAWLPILLVENSQMSRQTGAAVESFRNEVVKANNNQPSLLPPADQKHIKLVEG